MAALSATPAQAREKLSRVKQMTPDEAANWEERWSICVSDSKETPRGAALTADESIECERGRDD